VRLLIPGTDPFLKRLLTVSCSPRYIKSVSVIDLAALPQVPGRVIGMDLATRDANAAFAELICADAQWLREEFDALIAASFSQPPAAPPRVPPPPARTGPPGHRWLPPGAPASTSPLTPPGQRRQRSPPAPPPTPGRQATTCWPAAP
jgi:hypothetical protein